MNLVVMVRSGSLAVAFWDPCEHTFAPSVKNEHVLGEGERPRRRRGRRELHDALSAPLLIDRAQGFWAADIVERYREVARSG